MIKTLCLILTVFCAAPRNVRVEPIEVDSNSFDSITHDRLCQAAIMLEDVFNSEEFARAVLHEHFNTGNKKMSSADIYKLIMSGADDAATYIKSPTADSTIDLRVRFFNKYMGHNNYGSTNMKVPRVTSTHRCFILNNDLKCYVSHLAHEYMHQIGFYDVRKGICGTKTESVPYKIGNIVDHLLDNQNHCMAIYRTCKPSAQ